MPGDVVILEQWQREHGGDDARWLVCPECEGEDFGVVCRFAGGRPFVAALVCVACDPPRAIPVNNGFLLDPEGE